jgi:AcrR family transcriptional regulator
MNSPRKEPPPSGIPWWPEKLRERRTPQVRLSQRRVVETALGLIESSGAIGGLTMRKLAAELGVTPTTVYWWAGNREQLIALVIDAIYSQVELPARSSDAEWDEQLFDLLDRLYAVLAAHSTLVPVIMNGVLAGPSGLGIVDRFMTILLDAGFSPEEAIDVHAGVTFLVFGFVAAGPPGTEPGAVQNSTGEYQMKDLDATLFPGLAAVGGGYARFTTRDNMRRAVRTFLAGVKTTRPA